VVKMVCPTFDSIMQFDRPIGNVRGMVGRLWRRTFGICEAARCSIYKMYDSLPTLSMLLVVIKFDEFIVS
jgi:hypothetical protein